MRQEGLARYRHISQDSNPFAQRRVRAEQARHYLARRQRGDNKQRSRRRGNIHGNSLVVGAQFFERAD